MSHIGDFLRNNKILYRFLTWVYRTINRNKIKGKKGNYIKLKSVKCNKTKFSIDGFDNNVIVGSHSYLENCNIVIMGNQCNVKIGENSVLKNVNIWCEDDKSSVYIGKNGMMMGNVHLASTEGKKIIIGDNFLFSTDVCVRTGDSHSILDEQGKRINLAKNVFIDEKVWIGNQVIVLKGSKIGRNSVIGSGSIVTKKFESNVVLAGNPAKVVKQNISWIFERK